MKLDYVNESTVVGDFDTNSFGVKVSSKMFKIFSSNIYKYPVRAVIREYCCNARDIHSFTKTTDNYELNIPTRLDPVFSVRDYGTGLSHRDVMTTFTQYFYSTKESSNDYVGCLGLGSKSLFSIVDSFIVTSWYNGEKSTYTCYMDESGEPKIAHVHTHESFEKNGLKVEASVKAEDLSQFRNELGFVFRFMDNPICNLTIPDSPKYDINTDKYSINYRESGESYVVMGGVAYKIEHKQIKDKELAKIVEHGVILYAPMGEVSFNPGREELSFDKTTLSYLEDALNFVKTDIKKQLQITINEKKSFFQAKVFVNYLTGIWKTSGLTLSYNDRIIGHSVSFPQDVQAKDPGKSTVIGRYKHPLYSKTCVYILVRNGQMSACKNEARRHKQSTVFFIDESLINLIGLCSEDYIDGDTIKPKLAPGTKREYVKKKIGGYLFGYNRSISYCYNSVQEVPEGSIYFIFNRKDFTNDICTHSILVELYLTLKDTHKLPNIYGVKQAPEKGIHLIKWIKDNPQVSLFRGGETKYTSYLMQSDPDFKKEWMASVRYNPSITYFPKEVRDCFKSNQNLVEKEKNLKKTFPLIDEIGYGNTLTPEQVKLIKGVIDALPH